MPNLTQNLVLDRCPHCAVASPSLDRQHSLRTNDHTGSRERFWSIYVCTRCGGVVSAWASEDNQQVQRYFPKTEAVSDDLPEKPRAFLQQAKDTLHAPAGAVMLAASAVDAMLKLKGYTKGSLYTRIDDASADHAITKDMALWAHDVRLDANDQRHADDEAPLPKDEDASRAVDFASALGELLFVLPGRVKRGMKT